MSSNIQQLFDLHRFHSQQDFPKILLYFPFGLILLLLRLSVCIIIWPLCLLLPKTSKLRSFLMKGICFLFGVFVKQDVSHRNERVKLLICNHISVLDHIIVDSVLNCTAVDNCSYFRPSFSYFSGVGSQREMINHTIDEFQTYGSDTSVMIFPEGAMTNGRFGLLQFGTRPFTLSLPIQPVVIHMSGISLISISASVLGTSIWCDLLWLLFVPYTVFTLRVLPSMNKNEKESAEEFSKRAQAYMASSLNLTPTVYTLQDKDEYEKHLTALPASTAETLHSQLQSRRANEYTPETNRMAVQVKEILPDVPLTVIQQDIGITQSVDDTILRILEGEVHYVPETISSNPASLNRSSSSSCRSLNNISNYDPGMEALPSLNTAVETFGKTSEDRMLSYQERKSALLSASRIRYLKKHGFI